MGNFVLKFDEKPHPNIMNNTNYRDFTTRQKALKVNLDPAIYGSLSEIGAGQDVAATFFQAGAASGTVAMTQSAYDMKISDSIYGESPRYVSGERLEAMLEKDYLNIVEKLNHRSDHTKFFAFADTIESLNFHRTNQGHGWLGVRFQMHPEGDYNTCIIHVKLNDNDALMQQKAVGRLGVNLIFACFYLNDNMEEFIGSLTDSIAPGRVEIDMFNITGPDFERIDNRLMSLILVRNGLTPAAMFGPDGNNVQPSEMLYKKNILVLRGRFRPPTKVNVDMLLTAYRQFKNDPEVIKEKLIVLCELSLNNLIHAGEGIDEKDFLDRVDILCSLGQTVVITNFKYYYKFVEYLSDINKGRKIGVILGVNNLSAIFDAKYYRHLSGGLLESFGIMFGRNVKLLVYPATNSHVDGLHNCENFMIEQNNRHLFQYLLDNNKIEDIEGVNQELLTIFSDDVLDMIKCGEKGWEKNVPNKVAKAIKKNCLFEYPCDPKTGKLKKLSQIESSN